MTPPPFRPLGHFWIWDIFEKCWPLLQFLHFCGFSIFPILAFWHLTNFRFFILNYLWDIFEFGTFLKNVDPPPLLPNWDIFEFQRFFIKAILQNIAKIIEIGTFLKNRDPPSVFKIPKLKLGHFCFFLPPPIGTLSQIFSIFYFDASLKYKLT